MVMNVWVCLDEYKSENIGLTRVLADFSEHLDVLRWELDNEKVIKLQVVIEDLDDLLLLPFVLGDDIVIYGVDSDLIMTKGDMVELGLG